MSETLRPLLYQHIPAALWWVAAPGFAWLVGLRVYQLLARRTVTDAAWWLRAGWHLALLLFVGAASFDQHTAFASLCLGLAIGVSLGVVAAPMTSIKARSTASSIQPNQLIGAGLSLLLVGRVAWRLIEGSSNEVTGWTLSEFVRNPSTMLLFGLFVAYDLVYSIGIVARVRRVRHSA